MAAPCQGVGGGGRIGAGTGAGWSRVHGVMRITPATQPSPCQATNDSADNALPWHLQPHVQVCHRRNQHGRSAAEIQALAAQWEPAPAAYPLLLLGGLLGRGGTGGGLADGGRGASGRGIAEVEMEEEEEEETAAEQEEQQQLARQGSASPASLIGSGEAASSSSVDEEDGGGGGDNDTSGAAAAATPAASRWAALGDDDGINEGADNGRRGSKRRHRGGGDEEGVGVGMPPVDDWRDLLGGGGSVRQQQQGTAAGVGAAGGTLRIPRGILSRGGGSSGRKRVRWPDQVNTAAAAAAAAAAGRKGNLRP